MLTHYYAQHRRIEVEIDDTLGVVPPRPLMRRTGFAMARRLSGAVPTAERLAPLSHHVSDGWSFIDANQFTPAAALSRLRRYGVVKHENNAHAVLTGCITVEIADTAGLDGILTKYRLSLVHAFRFAPHLYQLRVQPGDEPIAVANAIATEEGVESAEPELLEALRPQQQPPGDPLLHQQQMQWEAVDARGAWNRGALGRGITIAVVDQGCFLDHPDLGPPFGPIGYFQDGADEMTTFQATTKNFPRKSHGTFCAGTAVARADNATGGRGMAPQAALSAVGLVRDTFSQEVMARAIGFATRPANEVNGSPERGADVISCSIDFSLPVRTVLQRALDATSGGRSGLGIPVFWAVPNERTAISVNGVCSASVVIAVGASIGRDGPDTCAFGPQLEFLAPGLVFSTSGGGGYDRHNGTSFATPLAAGVAALMLGINGDLRIDQLRSLMRACCTPIGHGGRTDTAGHGVINAAAAVRLAHESLPTPVE